MSREGTNQFEWSWRREKNAESSLRREVTRKPVFYVTYLAVLNRRLLAVTRASFERGEGQRAVSYTLRHSDDVYVSVGDNSKRWRDLWTSRSDGFTSFFYVERLLAWLGSGSIWIDRFHKRSILDKRWCCRCDTCLDGSRDNLEITGSEIMDCYLNVYLYYAYGCLVDVTGGLSKLGLYSQGSQN